MRSTRTNKSRRSKRLLKLLIILLVVGIVVLGYKALNNDDPASQVSEATSDTASTINYDPPTEEEKQQAAEAKDKIINEQPTPTVTASDGRKSVTPIIASANSSGASAYVPGIFEDGGTCTATYTHVGDKVTATSKGFTNSNYTSCEPLTLSSPLNIKGEWQVVVSYSSKAAVGSSAVTKVTVN